MKNIGLTTAALTALALFATPVAFAQSNDSSYCRGCTPTTPSNPTIGFTVDVGAASAGDFTSYWNGADGGATAEEEGGAEASFDYMFNSCPDGSCGPQVLQVKSKAWKVGKTSSWVTSNKADTPITAGGTAVARAIGFATIDMAPPPVQE